MGKVIELPERKGVARVAVAAVLFALVALTLFLSLDDIFGIIPESSPLTDFVGRYFSMVPPLLAAALVLARGVLKAEDRIGWLTLGVSLALWGAGNLTFYVLYYWADTIPVPSPADVMYIVSYAFMFVAVVLLAKRHVQERELWLDGAIAGLAVLAVSTAVMLPTLSDIYSKDLPYYLTNLSYVVGDMIFTGMCVAALSIAGWRTDRSFTVLTAGFITLGVCDSWFIYLSASDAYVSGSIIDDVWWIAFTIIALSAWQPITSARRAIKTRMTRRVLIAPTAAAVTAAGLLAWGATENGNLHWMSLAVSTVTMGLVITRMVLLMSEHLGMLHTAEHQAESDVLTGLGNRRKLEIDLEQAFADLASRQHSSLSLIMYDLDGFKQYNDTFGHPAGDALLIRLANKLLTAVGDAGTVYRLGGDEFCAVVCDMDEAELAAFEVETSGALVETGEQISITASYGRSTAPSEALTASDLMRVADQRMYAFKFGERYGADTHIRKVLLETLKVSVPQAGSSTSEMSAIAQTMATNLQLPADDVKRLMQAMDLHDIGKIAIPDAVLGKPSALDDSEWAIVRKHPVIAERILSVVPALADCAEIVRSTHERWDGKGYPDGLQGEAIPLAARIIAVCDAYAAMTSERPYRAQRSSKEAMDELTACAGSQFDANVVAAFGRAMAQVHIRAVDAQGTSTTSPTV